MKKVLPLLFLVYCFTGIASRAYSQAPLWNWAADAGSVVNAHDKGTSVTTDANGNFYVAGYFYSPTLTIDSITLTNTSANFKADVILAKYNSAGNLVWARNAGGNDHDYALSCSVDSVGNIYVAGYFTSSVLTFGGFSLSNAGAEDLFVAQYNSSGNVNWAKSYGGLAADIAFSICSDADGNAIVGGYFQSADLDLVTDTLHNTGGMDLFVMKCSFAGGTVQWAATANGSDNDVAYSVTTDASGNVYAGGYYMSTQLDFGPSWLGNSGVYDVFVAKYDGGGNLQWVTGTGGSDSDVSHGIAADNAGNVYLTGFFGSTSIPFGSTVLSSGGGIDFFLASYDSAGNDRWAKSAGAAYGEEGNGVCTDLYGNVYVAGTFESPTVSFGNTTLTNGGNFMDDIFLAGYDNSGNLLWAKGAGGGDVDVASSVSADKLANIFVTGFYGSTTLSLDGITLSNSTAAPYQDLFVARLSTYVGLNQSIHGDGITVYPNPVLNDLTVSNPSGAVSAIEIHNMLGEKVLDRKSGQHDEIKMDVSMLQAGVYFVQLHSHAGITVRKFVKQ
jgi:hypothetical protein